MGSRLRAHEGPSGQDLLSDDDVRQAISEAERTAPSQPNATDIEVRSSAIRDPLLVVSTQQVSALYGGGKD